MSTQESIPAAASSAPNVPLDTASTPIAASSTAQDVPAPPSATAATAATPKAATDQLQSLTTRIQQICLLHLLNRLRRRVSLPSPPVKQRIGEHDLLIEGLLKVTDRNGTVISIPLNTMLPGALTPAFLPMAQVQFGSVLEHLFIKPATVAFIAHTEKFRSEKTKPQRSIK